MRKDATANHGDARDLNSYCNGQLNPVRNSGVTRSPTTNGSVLARHSTNQSYTHRAPITPLLESTAISNEKERRS